MEFDPERNQLRTRYDVRYWTLFFSSCCTCSDEHGDEVVSSNELTGPLQL